MMMFRRCTIAVALLILSALWGTRAFAGPSDAVVLILTDTVAGKSGYGSGFFISPDGKVATCYHVIANSTKIRIITKNGAWNEDVVVESISPQYDLAILRIQRPDRQFPFIELSNDAPSLFGNVNLDVWGHPAVLTNSQAHLRATPTADAFIKSSVPRSRETFQNLFALKEVDLIPVTMDIFNGVSGSPLLFRNRAVGVVSGSLDEGGSIAWAIPIKYISRLSAVGLPAQQVAHWPPLALMASSWKNLRQEARIGLSLVVALDTYGRAVADERKAFEAISDFRTLLAAAVTRTENGIANLLRRRGRNAKLASVGSDVAQLVERSMQPFNDYVSQFETQTEGFTERYLNSTANLKYEATQYFDSLPDTLKNRTLRERTIRAMQAQRDMNESYLKDLEQLVSDFDRSNNDVNTSVNTLGDAELLISASHSAARKFIDKMASLAEQMLENYRSLDDIVNGIFNAEPDLPTPPKGDREQVRGSR